jgi:hypothetical protein
VRTSLLAAAFAAVTLLAGCASEPPADEPATTSEAPTGHGTLAQCLREHGVPAAPGPAAGPPASVDPAAWNQAMQSCASLAPGPAG